MEGATKCADTAINRPEVEAIANRLRMSHAMGDRITALCVRSRCRKAPSFLSIVTSPPPSRKTATEAGGPSVSAPSFGILIEVTAMDLRATGGAILSNKVEKEQTHTLSLEVV